MKFTSYSSAPLPRIAVSKTLLWYYVPIIGVLLLASWGLFEGGGLDASSLEDA